jgi:hypothetical protein
MSTYKIKNFSVTIKKEEDAVTPASLITMFKLLNDRNNIELVNRTQRESLKKSVHNKTTLAVLHTNYHSMRSVRTALRINIKRVVRTDIVVTLPPMSHKKRLKLQAIGAPSLPSYTTKTDFSFQKNRIVLLQRAESCVRDLINRIQSARAASREIQTRTKTFTTNSGRVVSFTVTGGYTSFNGRKQYNTGFTEPNSIIKIQQKLKVQGIFEPKKPTTTERHIGIEIEFACVAGKTELADALYNADVASYVQLKDDGSIRDFPSNHKPHELVVCVPISKRADVISRVCGVLEKLNANVNKTCGLHVHLDMRNDNVSSAFNNLVSAQNILYQMIPQSRRTNTYCKKTLTKDYVKARRSSDRYVGINPMSFSRHSTIEVRLHSGTTNYTKIINFVDILIAVAYNSARIVRAATTVRGFIRQHDIPSYLGAYIEQRITLFGGLSSVEESA